MNYWVVIYRFAWTILTVLLLIGLACVFAPKCRTVRELQRQKRDTEIANRAREHAVDELKRKQERFLSDPAFVERTARETGMIKPDEILFKLTNHHAGPAP